MKRGHRTRTAVDLDSREGRNAHARASAAPTLGVGED